MLKLAKLARKPAAIRILISALGTIVILAVVIFATFRRAGPPPASTQVRVPSAPATAVATLPPEETPPPVVYQSRGRRDPFRQPRVATAQKEPVVNLKLTGIVWGPRFHYALVESETASGVGYVIREHDVVDSARVLKITKDTVLFEVKWKSTEGKSLTRFVQKRIRPVDSK